jgi:hypothetical protein
LFELSGEISGRPINDMGDWSALVDNLLGILSGTTQQHTVKGLVDTPRNLYLASDSFWVELKEMI